jgi:hypothetical protein
LGRYPVLSKDIERIKEISKERLSSVAEVADSAAVAKLLNGPLNDPVPGGDAVSLLLRVQPPSSKETAVSGGDCAYVFARGMR